MNPVTNPENAVLSPGHMRQYVEGRTYDETGILQARNLLVGLERFFNEPEFRQGVDAAIFGNERAELDAKVDALPGDMAQAMLNAGLVPIVRGEDDKWVDYFALQQFGDLLRHVDTDHRSRLKPVIDGATWVLTRGKFHEWPDELSIGHESRQKKRKEKDEKAMNAKLAVYGFLTERALGEDLQLFNFADPMARMMGNIVDENKETNYNALTEHLMNKNHNMVNRETRGGFKDLDRRMRRTGALKALVDLDPARGGIVELRDAESNTVTYDDYADFEKLEQILQKAPSDDVMRELQQHLDNIADKIEALSGHSVLMTQEELLPLAVYSKMTRRQSLMDRGHDLYDEGVDNYGEVMKYVEGKYLPEAIPQRVEDANKKGMAEVLVYANDQLREAAMLGARGKALEVLRREIGEIAGGGMRENIHRELALFLRNPRNVGVPYADAIEDVFSNLVPAQVPGELLDLDGLKREYLNVERIDLGLMIPANADFRALETDFVPVVKYFMDGRNMAGLGLTPPEMQQLNVKLRDALNQALVAAAAAGDEIDKARALRFLREEFRDDIEAGNIIIREVLDNFELPIPKMKGEVLNALRAGRQGRRARGNSPGLVDLANEDRQALVEALENEVVANEKDILAAETEIDVRAVYGGPLPPEREVPIRSIAVAGGKELGKAKVDLNQRDGVIEIKLSPENGLATNTLRILTQRDNYARVVSNLPEGELPAIEALDLPYMGLLTAVEAQDAQARINAQLLQQALQAGVVNTKEGYVYVVVPEVEYDRNGTINSFKLKQYIIEPGGLENMQAEAAKHWGPEVQNNAQELIDELVQLRTLDLAEIKRELKDRLAPMHSMLSPELDRAINELTEKPERLSAFLEAYLPNYIETNRPALVAIATELPYSNGEEKIRIHRLLLLAGLIRHQATLGADPALKDGFDALVADLMDQADRLDSRVAFMNDKDGLTTKNRRAYALMMLLGNKLVERETRAGLVPGPDIPLIFEEHTEKPDPGLRSDFRARLLNALQANDQVEAKKILDEFIVEVEETTNQPLFNINGKGTYAYYQKFYQLTRRQAFEEAGITMTPAEIENDALAVTKFKERYQEILLDRIARVVAAPLAQPVLTPEKLLEEITAELNVLGPRITEESARQVNREVFEMLPDHAQNPPRMEKILEGVQLVHQYFAHVSAHLAYQQAAGVAVAPDELAAAQTRVRNYVNQVVVQLGQVAERNTPKLFADINNLNELLTEFKPFLGYLVDPANLLTAVSDPTQVDRYAEEVNRQLAGLIYKIAKHIAINQERTTPGATLRVKLRQWGRDNFAEPEFAGFRTALLDLADPPRVEAFSENDFEREKLELEHASGDRISLIQRGKIAFRNYREGDDWAVRDFEAQALLAKRDFYLRLARHELALPAVRAALGAGLERLVIVLEDRDGAIDVQNPRPIAEGVLPLLKQTNALVALANMTTSPALATKQIKITITTANPAGGTTTTERDMAPGELLEYIRTNLLPNPDGVRRAQQLLDQVDQLLMAGGQGLNEQVRRTVVSPRLMRYRTMVRREVLAERGVYVQNFDEQLDGVSKQAALSLLGTFGDVIPDDVGRRPGLFIARINARAEMGNYRDLVTDFEMVGAVARGMKNMNLEDILPPLNRRSEGDLGNFYAKKLLYLNVYMNFALTLGQITRAEYDAWKTTFLEGFTLDYLDKLANPKLTRSDFLRKYARPNSP